VYVVELSDRVWNEPSFRKANPDCQLSKPLVYVGMTGLDPDLRFDRHKAGIQANRFVLQYGLRLLPQLYEVYNPMPYEAAREMEVELAIGLREAGYGVWQALGCQGRPLRPKRKGRARKSPPQGAHHADLRIRLSVLRQ
jgi:hypothetical protein